jgi:hypothetical protein
MLASKRSVYPKSCEATTPGGTSRLQPAGVTYAGWRESGTFGEWAGTASRYVGRRRLDRWRVLLYAVSKPVRLRHSPLD